MDGTSQKPKDNPPVTLCSTEQEPVFSHLTIWRYAKLDCRNSDADGGCCQRKATIDVLLPTGEVRRIRIEISKEGGKEGASGSSDPESVGGGTAEPPFTHLRIKSSSCHTESGVYCRKKVEPDGLSMDAWMGDGLGIRR